MSYLTYISEFKSYNEEIILSKICESETNLNDSLIYSWSQIIKDLKRSNLLNKLPDKIIIGIEYKLPVSGMAADIILIGVSKYKKPIVYIIESKLWLDKKIYSTEFSSYRADDNELHPQIQVSRHINAFENYLDIGGNFLLFPFVYTKMLSDHAINTLVSKNHDSSTNKIPITNNIDIILNNFTNEVSNIDFFDINKILNAKYKPSIDIIKAMESLTTSEEPFILTERQITQVHEIEEKLRKGYRIIKLEGPPGSGKTAIMLHLYVNAAKNNIIEGIKPIFISGSQNTAFYKSYYSSVEQSFTYSFSLPRMITNTNDNYLVFIDEAQHNESGIISKLLGYKNVQIVLCYDINQTINANNSINELRQIEQNPQTYKLILNESIRYNNSDVFISNVLRALNGNFDTTEDKLYDFKIYAKIEDFKQKIVSIANENIDTLAIIGLLSNNAEDFTRREPLFEVRWSYKTECQWMPYVLNKNYSGRINKKFWVGTWWMPGLDVDYVAVIIGNDVKIIDNKLEVSIENSKAYNTIVSVAENLNFPKSVFIFDGDKINRFKSKSKIIEYINSNRDEYLRFYEVFKKMLLNNYYIMLTRGRKGCYLYFDSKDF